MDSSVLTLLSFGLNDLGADSLTEADTYPPLSLFHSNFLQQLLSTYCVPDTVLGSGNTVLSKNACRPCHCGGCRFWGESANN